ncbi:MAG: hypothetical protein R6U19_00500 [Bacteroidales bacterium]
MPLLKGVSEIDNSFSKGRQNRLKNDFQFFLSCYSTNFKQGIKTCITLILILACQPGNSQALKPGNLGIVGINVEHASSHPFHLQDEISLVSFDTIPVGSSIDITDNGWAQTYPGYWGNREGIIRITRIQQALLPGEVFTFRGSGNRPENFNIYPDTNNWVVEVLDTTHYFNLTSDDQVWILHGGQWDQGPATDSATYTGYPLFGWTATGWAGDPLHGAHGTTEYSELFPAMQCLFPQSLSLSHKAKYRGPTSPAKQRTWIKRLTDISNWKTKNTSSAYHNSNPNYIAGYNFDVLPSDSLTYGNWIGDHNNNWFDCNNWSDLVVPDKNADVTIASGSETYAEIKTTAPYSDMFNDSAQCKNLNIYTDSLILGNTDALINITADLSIHGGRLSAAKGNILIKGNWLNKLADGFKTDSSRVTFYGDTVQYIYNAGNHEIFNHIYIQNPLNIQLQTNTTVHTLSFVSGRIFLDDFNLHVSGNIFNYGTDRYCVTKNDHASGGSLRMRATSSPAVFPVGTDTSYTPATITSLAGESEYIVRTFYRLRENGYGGNVLAGNIVEQSWAIETAQPNIDSAHIKLQWNLSDESSGFTAKRASADMIQNPADGNGSGWNDWTFLTNSSTPTGSNPFEIQTMNIKEFGVFGVSADRCVILKPNTSPILYFK